MDSSKAGLLGLIVSRKALVAVVVVAVLILASTATAVALSELRSTVRVPRVYITDMTHDPDEAYVDQPVTWSATVVFDGANIVSKTYVIMWFWDDLTGSTRFVKPNQTTTVVVDVVTHAWAAPGVYNVTVSVWEYSVNKMLKVTSASMTSPFLVSPEPVNTPPTAYFVVSPTEGTVYTVFTFDASNSSDLEDSPESLQVRWDWESDGLWDTGFSVNKVAYHQFSWPTTYYVSMEVMDSGNLSNTTSCSVTVRTSDVLTPHEPIYIYGDGSFTYENGVVGGSGAPDDPYIISGWRIEAYGENAITVLYAQSHFVIRDVELVGDVDTSQAGIRIEWDNCTTVERASISGFYYGIYAKSTNSLVVRSCEIVWNSNGVFGFIMDSLTVVDSYISHFVGTGNNDGVAATDVWAILVMNNTMEGNMSSAVFLHSCGLATVIDNYADGWIQVLYTKVGISSNIVRSGGIIVAGCQDSEVSWNTVGSYGVNQELFGIWFDMCANLTIQENLVYSFRYGIGTHYSVDPLPNSEDVLISGNGVSGCFGSGLRLYYISGLTVVGNKIASCALGIDVTATATNVSVYHNDFVNNAMQASESVLSTGNTWDDGYPSGGNYWSDYTGVDEYKGPDQTELGKDGIGDTPYVLASGSQDNYPLMYPYGTNPEITTPLATYSKVTILNGVRINILSISNASVPWSDVRVRLTDGFNVTEWCPFTEDLDGGVAAVANYSTSMLGTLAVCCLVFDIGGNGRINGGDYFTLFTYGGAVSFRPGVSYTAVLVYEPSGETIGTGISFTG